MRALCGLLLEKKEALKPPTHMQALPALLPAIQLTPSEGEEERRSLKRTDKDKGRGYSDFDKICNPISQLTIVTEV